MHILIVATINKLAQQKIFLIVALTLILQKSP